MTTPNTGTPAPATPAPAVPATPTPTSGTPQLSAVEQASADARARLASTGTIAPAEPHHSTEQPRVQGKFFKSQVKEVGANVNTGEEPTGEEATTRSEASPGDGQGAQSEEQAGEVPDSQTGEEAAGEGTEEEGGDDLSADDLSVVIPGRNPNEEIEITVSDPETAERLRQLSNGYMRGEEARTVLEQAEIARQHVDEFEDMIAADPGGVFMSALRDDPNTQAHMALYLLTRPEILQRIGPVLQKHGVEFQDANALENLALRMEVERRTLSDNFKQTAQERRSWQENAKQVRMGIAAMVPANMPEAQQATFITDALRDIVEYCDATNTLTIPPQQLPLILAARMKANGIDPVEAATRLADMGSTNRSNRSSDNGAARAKPANGAAPLPQAPQRTGQQMVEARNAKRRVAVVPGAGAGAGGNAATPPAYDPSKPGSATEQRLAWHRQQLSLRKSAAS